MAGMQINNPSNVPRHAIMKVSTAGPSKVGISAKSRPTKRETESKTSAKEPIRSQSVSSITVALTLQTIRRNAIR